jgi:peptidoglycan/xylan/chitin deacetylase (PgdA/CDA1 family)
MLKTLKQRFLTIGRATGMLEAVARSEWRRRRLLILCYHSLSVDQEHGWRRALFFTPEEFEARLEQIRRFGLNVLPLDDALTRLRAGTLPPRSAVLTFDDGSADFHDIVVPMLRRYGYAATVYVSTYYIEKRLPIFPLMVSYLLWKGRAGRLGPSQVLGLRADVDLSDLKQRNSADEEIVGAADREGLTAQERERQLEYLAAELSVDYLDLRRRRVLQLMTPEEVRHVAEAGFDVQLHTHRHRTALEQSGFVSEIAENRSRIEVMTSLPARHFCYPRGVYHPQFQQWLTDANVSSATTCVPGLADARSNVLLLPRVVDTAGLSPIEFEGWMSGVSHLFPRRSET